MKQIQIVCTLFFSLLLLAGCSKDDGRDELFPPDNGGKIVFRMNIGGGVQTKVATDADFKSLFEEGDEVGVFAVKRKPDETKELAATGNYIHNAKLTYQNGSWSSVETYYYPGSGDVLDFYAYYPYDEDITDATAIAVRVSDDQHSVKNYGNSDFLSAQAPDIGKGNPVTLNFKHEMAMVQIELSRTDVIPNFDENFRVTFSSCAREGSFNWKNGVKSHGGLNQSLVMHPVAGLANTFRALLPAQSFDNGTFTFTQSTSGKEIDLEYGLIGECTFSSGKVTFFHYELDTDDFDPEHRYAEGDLYPYKGEPVGIVFEVTNGGKNGKIVSLKEAKKQWSIESVFNATNRDNGRNNMATIVALDDWESKYPVFSWVHQMNEAGVEYRADATGIWYLPAIEELEAVSKSWNKNRDLWHRNISELGSSYPLIEGIFYWSSSENDSFYAWGALFIHDGEWESQQKKFDYPVRGVLAF